MPSKETGLAKTTKPLPSLSRQNSSPTPSARSKLSAKDWRIKTTFLAGTLPEGALSIFQQLRVGKGLGIPCKCPYCGEGPPVGMPGYQRRRWQAVHLAIKHVKGETPIQYLNGHAKVLDGKVLQKAKKSLTDGARVN